MKKNQSMQLSLNMKSFSCAKHSKKLAFWKQSLGNKYGKRSYESIQNVIWVQQAWEILHIDHKDLATCHIFHRYNHHKPKKKSIEIQTLRSEIER